jgi:hypothetical protein
MSATFRVFAPDSAHHNIDLDALSITDRAALRLLNRAGAETAVQLSRLVYGSLRVSQKHLLRLYQSGLLERLPLADERYGQAEYAYRLSTHAHEQLQTGSPLSPGIYLRHTLDIVSTVCALNQTDDCEHPPVQLWYAASMTTNILSRFLRPDSIVLVTTEAGSVVLALEIDEGLTAMRGVRTKLAAYRRPLASRPNWHLLVVVQSQLRAEWMLRQIRAIRLGERTSVVTLAALAKSGLDAPLQQVSGSQPSQTLRSLLRPPQRLLPAPVGSRAWLELLGGGGGETEKGALAP